MMCTVPEVVQLLPTLPAGLAGGGKWSELLPAGFHLCRSDCSGPLLAGFGEVGGS